MNKNKFSIGKTAPSLSFTENATAVYLKFLFLFLQCIVKGVSRKISMGGGQRKKDRKIAKNTEK